MVNYLNYITIVKNRLSFSDVQVLPLVPLPLVCIPATTAKGLFLSKLVLYISLALKIK